MVACDLRARLESIRAKPPSFLTRAASGESEKTRPEVACHHARSPPSVSPQFDGEVGVKILGPSCSVVLGVARSIGEFVSTRGPSVERATTSPI